MNIRDLSYIIAVADTGHFSQAAKQCFVSQPALSMQIKKLEDELGVMLFERTNKKVMITDAGKEITAHARQILRETGAIKDIAANYSDPLAGKIIMGAFPTLAPYILPRIIPELHETFGRLAFFLREEKTEILIENLLSGELEVALLALPVAEDRLDHSLLFRENFWLAVHEDNPLARKKQVSTADIQDESLLLLEEGHCLRDQALDVCMSMGALENTEFRATSLETLRQMVAANVGITLIPSLAVTETRGVRYIPFEAPAPSRRIGLFWRKSSTRQILIKEITAKIQGLFRNQSALILN